MDLTPLSTAAADTPSRGAAVRRELREAVRLSVPVAMIQLGMMMMGVVDTMMLGHLSATALAAGSLGHILTFTFLILGSGTLTVLDPLISQAFGAGDHRAIGDHLQRGIVLAFVLAIPLGLIMWDVTPLLRLFGEEPVLASHAAAYIRAISWGNLPFLLFVALRQTLQAMSIVRPALVAIAIGNVVNAIGNYLLIFGHYGAPTLGVEGSAYSTAICRWVMFFYLLAAGFRRLGPYWRSFNRDAFDLRRQARLIRLGLPLGIHMSIELGVFATVALMIGTMGVHELAGHQIALNLASLSFMFPLGIGGAVATRVGNAIGRSDMPGARLAAVVGLALGGGVMLLFALAFWALPRQLAGLYTNDGAVIAVAAYLLPIAAAFQVFDGLQVVAAGALRGAGDTHTAAVTALIAYWAIGLPLGWYLSRYLSSPGQGPSGLWWGLTVGIAVLAFLLLARVALRFRSDIARISA